MAWRLGTNLIGGTLDNTTPGKVTGELRFIGRKRRVRLDLVGDFDGECRGRQLVLRNQTPEERNSAGAGSYMDGFAGVQRGEVGLMKIDKNGAYLEWYGDKNGRVVIELAPCQVQVRPSVER